MNSYDPSELLDLERGLPTTERDVEAEIAVVAVGGADGAGLLPQLGRQHLFLRPGGLEDIEDVKRLVLVGGQVVLVDDGEVVVPVQLLHLDGMHGSRVYYSILASTIASMGSSGVF